MKIVMGLVVMATGVAILPHTAMGFIQIIAGAFLAWRGVCAEIQKEKVRKLGKEAT